MLADVDGRLSLARRTMESVRHERAPGEAVSIAVRPAVLSDAAAIATFQTECWREACSGVVPQEYLNRVGVAEREVRWSDRLATGAREVALAEVNGAVVGVVSWVTPLKQQVSTL